MMKKVLKKIAIVVVGLVLAVLAFATTKPSTLHVERSTVIQAPPDAIRPLINDFHNWTSWSPYEKRDPALKRTFRGTPAGKGAVYEWNGNSEVGSGRMEILDTTPSSTRIKLDFIEPFEGHNTAEFSLEPAGNATTVRWSIDGPNTYLSKVMCVFIDMDQMIGKDFEAGLANMKAVSESKRRES